jgi:quercetin dioxygenase-like cupin family protein
MRKAVIAAGALLAALLSGPASSQAVLDPSHVLAIMPKDIKWQGPPGEERAPLFGDQTKPGVYALLIKWSPGNNSQPHSHSMDRVGYVISGTWWTSTSTTPDKATMKPIPAGSTVLHVANTVHWDGARDEETIILMTGVGPVTTTRIAQP